MKDKSLKEWFRRIKVPRVVIIIICALPAVLTGLFYILRLFPGIMDWVAIHLSSPVRAFLGLLSSIYPFSVMEVLLTAAGIWFIYYIVRTVMVTVHRRGKMKILGKRLLPVAVAALYIWSLFCWLWNSGYHAPGFAEKNGFKGSGVSVSDLTEVTRFFAGKANEFSLLVNRDEEGRFVENRREMFTMSTDVYQNVAIGFPSLGGRLYPPKPMIYSWLMSRTGYTGIYFALTGEANINTRAPGFLMPLTVAHEHAHQLGIFAEDEANFVGILACVTSDITLFEYSGYLRGLIYLMNALMGVDFETWREIGDTLTDEVNRDWQENFEYWQAQRRVETGIKFIDNILTSVTVTVSDAVDTIYDSYLKSQSQELGIQSYGACVDLLVEYYSVRIPAQ